MQLPTMRQMGAVLLGKYHTARRIQVIIVSLNIYALFYQLYFEGPVSFIVKENNF